jgi:hypothetical protein
MRSPGAIVLRFLVLAAAIAAVLSDDDPAAEVKKHDVRTWAPPRTKPQSDAQAAALVDREPENVQGNTRRNRYVPSLAQLAAFRAARNEHGQTTMEANPLMQYVTGRPGLRHPSTDELIQWVSHKWGHPTDWIRAQMVVESHWFQGHLGDRRTVPPAWYGRYPAFARVPGGDQVYESLGIAQVKWRPDGSVGAGTEPLRWKSTAFNLDTYAATVRYYYDGDCNWCTGGYGAGQAWNSVGAWYSPHPWANANALRYVRKVRQALKDRAWTRIER